MLAGAGLTTALSPLAFTALRNLALGIRAWEVLRWPLVDAARWHAESANGDFVVVRGDMAVHGGKMRTGSSLWPIQSRLHQ